MGIHRVRDLALGNPPPQYLLELLDRRFQALRQALSEALVYGGHAGSNVCHRKTRRPQPGRVRQGISHVKQDVYAMFLLLQAPPRACVEKRRQSSPSMATQPSSSLDEKW